MAGKVPQFDNRMNGSDNQKLHMEMLNVSSLQNKHLASGNDQNIHNPEQVKRVYVEMAENNVSRGSLLSLNSKFVEQSDVLPLTENHMCNYKECMTLHSLRNNNVPESPGSPAKNIFFGLVIVMLLVWIIIYALLNKMNFL